MAKKTSLREFQKHLAERLISAAAGRNAASLLGVRAGEENWLVDLSESGEIVQAPRLTPVPLTKPWFAGLAKLKAKDPSFPKPIKDGDARQAAAYYVVAEVDTWLQAKIAARDMAQTDSTEGAKNEYP